MASALWALWVFLIASAPAGDTSASVLSQVSGTHETVSSAQLGSPMLGPQTGLQKSAAACVGDCGGDGAVTVNEILLMVNVALGAMDGNVCPAGDTNGDGQITVDEIVTAVNNALAQCPAPTPTPTPGPSPGDPSVAALVAALTGTGSLVQAVAATQQALARGGVATADLQTVYVSPVEPASSAVALPHETLNLALEARKRASMWSLSVADLGRMLRDFGWPFAPESTPGEQLMKLLQLWIAGAQARPEDPQSFAPLFIAEMAKQQIPPVDLTTGTASPYDAHLSMLELELFAAAFDRLVTNAVGAERRTPERSGNGSSAADEAPEPCSDLKSVIEKAFGPIGEYAWGEILQRSGEDFMSDVLKAAGVSSVTLEAFEKSLSAVSILARIWKLIELYRKMQVSVTVDATQPLHKPLDVPAPVIFVARAGVSEADWREYVDQYGEWGMNAESALRDCLEEFGIPTFADLAEIASEAAQWDVEWRIAEGSPQHAEISPANEFEFPGQLQNSLERVSPTSAETSLIVDILPEDARYHSDAPPKNANVVVCAKVETSQPPSLKTFINAATAFKDPLGLVDALVELGAGWLQSMATPSNCGTLRITYHDQPVKGWHGTIRYTETISESSATESAPGDFCGAFADSCGGTHERDYFYRNDTTIEGSEGFTGNEDGVQVGVYTLRGTATVDAIDTIVDTEHAASSGTGCFSRGMRTERDDLSGSDRIGGELIIFNGRYIISVDRPSPPGTSETQSVYDAGGNPRYCTPEQHESVHTDPWTWSALADPGIQGSVDTGNPYRITGSAAGTALGKVNYQLYWDLTYTPE